MNKKYNGFALVESLLIILILAIVGIGGYAVWRNEHKAKSAANSLSSPNQKNPDAANKKDTTQEPAVELSLDDGKVSFSSPADWSRTPPTGKCMISVYSSADCLDRLYVSPIDASKAETGDAFGVAVTVAAYDGSTSLKDWYWNVYQGEEQSSSDTVSSNSINGYDAYSRTQTTTSYTDKYYVLHKDQIAVVISARVSDTHFTANGAIDEHHDYTQYTPQITDLINSVTIK